MSKLNETVSGILDRLRPVLEHARLVGANDVAEEAIASALDEAHQAGIQEGIALAQDAAEGWVDLGPQPPPPPSPSAWPEAESGVYLRAAFALDATA